MSSLPILITHRSRRNLDNGGCPSNASRDLRSATDFPGTLSGRDTHFPFGQNPVLGTQQSVPSTLHDQGRVKMVSDLAQLPTSDPVSFSSASFTRSHTLVPEHSLAAQDMTGTTTSLIQATPNLLDWFSSIYATTSGDLGYSDLYLNLAPDQLGLHENSSRQPHGPVIEHHDHPFNSNIHQNGHYPEMTLQRNSGQDISCPWIQNSRSIVDPMLGLSTFLPQFSGAPFVNEIAFGSDFGLQTVLQDCLPAWSNQNSTTSEALGNDSYIPKSDCSILDVSSKSKARKLGRDASHIHPKRARTQPSLSFEACLINFEVKSGDVQKRRRRPKLPVDKRKELTLQRHTGACHQCRFRKRACSLDTPCGYCRTIAGQLGIAKHICYRDSPFVYRIASDYFIYTSAKRTLNFFFDPPKRTTRRLRGIAVRPNERGFYSAPLQLQVFDCDLHALSDANREVLLSKSRVRSEGGKVTVVNESDESLGNRLEQWALEYGIAFAKTQNHRAGRLLLIGVMWIKLNLPESRLVQVCMRMLTLNYILRTGVTYCSGKCTDSYRAVEARIDTVVYQRIKQAESEFNQLLESMVWKSYGRLTRQQSFPVAYVLWQYLRLMCLRVSHIKNLITVYKYKGLDYGPISRTTNEMNHMYNLLLSIHTALFRSSSPLLMDFSDVSEQDVLAGNLELIEEAAYMRTINDRFRNVSYGRHFRSARAFEQQTVDKLRKVLDGEGLKFK
ncbi:hypothetical protein BP5796_05014 [Coleophoma crateriformis]|uniref:Zn(2)-C6 fungal-type domain-containing protein n=1 Tax=Coleophoma crateriformis TaxID=565419 RepID=A0A3D8SB80_9HELO|nr:hypothetical protein BP5796_05014 [Coleophoma crateriformis]